MKKHEEMIQSVHKRMDEYEAEKQQKRVRTRRSAAVLTPVFAAAVLGVGLWKGGAFIPADNKYVDMPHDVVASTADTVIIIDNVTTAAKITGKTTAEEKKPAETGTTAIKSEAATSEKTGEKSSEPAPENEPDTEKAAQEDIPSEPTEVPDAHAEESENTSQVQPKEEESQQSVTTERPNLSTGDMEACVCVDGIVYNQTFPENSNGYSCGEYIGEAEDFEGTCVGGALYRASEDSDIIILKFYAGGQVYMKRSDYSAEKFAEDMEKIREMRHKAVF